MTLSELSIRRPVFAWMLMAALIIFGWLSFKRMGISQMPDADFPVLSINVTYEGAAPEVMESDVVDPLEDAVMTVQGIKSVSSHSRYGQATITLEFTMDRNIEDALQEVQTKLASAQKNLPRDLDTPVINKTNPEDQPILWLTASTDVGTTQELMRYVRDHIKDKFTTVPGVGEVFLGGYVEPNLRVWISSQKLNSNELTVSDVLDTIRDEHSELPAGQIETARKEVDIRTLGEAHTVKEFEDIVISGRGGRPNYAATRVGQVARVEEGLAEVRRISRVLGRPAVGLGIRKQRGSNAVAVANLVKHKMEEMQSALPKGMRLAVNFDSTRFIEESVGELNFTLILSALLTSLVCWMFLGSWSSTFNVLMAIPTSIIGAFIVLGFLGFTLNTFTLLGLSLAIGIVVDDAIMVLENIVRHREKGLSRMDAALVGSKEIGFAAMAATMAIVAIFLPVAFMRGVIGKFFFQFGVTLTVTVLISLLEALTLTPMRCSQFVEVPERTTRIGKLFEHWMHRSQEVYHSLLEILLRHRVKVLLSSMVFFVLSLITVKWINKELVPAQDQSSFLVRMTAPADSSLTYTDSKFKEAEVLLAKHPEIIRYFVAVGGFGGGEVNTGNIFVTLKPRDQRALGQQQIMDALRKELSQIKDVKVFLQDLSMRGFSASRGFPVEFSIRGQDWKELERLSVEMVSRLNKTGLVSDLDSDFREGKTEIRVIPNRIQAAKRGVSIRAISETINVLIGGAVAGKYSMGGHRYDIRVRLDSQERDRADQIRALFVRNNRGELVRLSEVVKLEEVPSQTQISRYDRERAINLFANVAPGKSQQDALAAAQSIGKEVMPNGYRVVMSGSAQGFKESFDDLKMALILGVLVAYMVLASQFNSFVDPITVLLALPFSLSGAFLALWISGQSLNMFSFIGIILLMGIVKKNSILLVEFTNQSRHANLSVHEALLTACPVRLRPILMTSFATIAGAIPPALALGPGAETRIPMAVTIIGGVLVSTVLTLLVVPCAYSLFAQISNKLKKTHKKALITANLLLVLLAGFELPSQAVTIDLNQAIDLGIQNSTQVKSAIEKLEQSSQQINSAISAALPVIEGQINASTRKESVNIFGSATFGGRSFNRYEANITASQILYKGGAVLAAYQSVKQQNQLAQLDLEIARRDVSLKVIENFFDVLLAQKRVETFKTNIQIEKEVQAITERKQRIGRGQLLDVLQIKTQIALLQPKLSNAQVEVRTAIADLAESLAMEPSELLVVTGSLNTPLKSLTSPDLNQETGKSLEEQKAQLIQEQFENTRTISLSEHYPTLRAVGAIGRTSFDKSQLFTNFAGNWSVGLQLTLPLFSGLSSIYQRREFNHQREDLNIQAHQIKLGVSLNRVKTQQDFEVAYQNLTASQEAYMLAQSTLDEAKKQYRLSLIDQTQYLATQQSYMEADLSSHQARHTLLLAIGRRLAANGEDPGKLRAILGEVK